MGDAGIERVSGQSTHLESLDDIKDHIQRHLLHRSNRMRSRGRVSEQARRHRVAGHLQRKANSNSNSHDCDNWSHSL
jgi:hypothetical protein